MIRHVLNSRQRRILWGGAAIFVLASVVPPWDECRPVRTRITCKPVGYALLFTGPALSNTYFGARVAFDRLALQWAVLAAAVVAACAAFRGDDQNRPPRREETHPPGPSQEARPSPTSSPQAPGQTSSNEGQQATEPTGREETQ